MFTINKLIQHATMVFDDNNITLNIKLNIVFIICAKEKSIKLNNPARILEKLAQLYIKSI